MVAPPVRWVGRALDVLHRCDSFLLGMNDIVFCPTCDLPAIAEYRFPLHSTDGPIEHLRISCIGGHGNLLLADRARYVELCDDLDIVVAPDESV